MSDEQTRQSWARVKDVFAAAVALPDGQRRSYIDRELAEEPSLQQQVHDLITAHETASSFLRTGGRRPTREITVPERIGPYRIEGVLGRGGMGIVYDAIDERLGRSVAVKVILETDRSSDVARQRFGREARIAAGVNHPHVCQIYDVGEIDEVTFLVMERLDGEALAARLSRGALPLGEATRIAADVLSALDALHRYGIVHRDLKPSNIFLTPHGAKLLDFGLARVAESAETQAQLTDPGMVLGTPRYMAPEQIRGEAVDERVDIFALSAILYEMLSGASPFDGDSVPAILQSILNVDPPMLGGSPGIAAVDRVIHRGLAKLAGQRFATASAMAQELERAVAKDDSDARAVSRLTRVIVLPFRLLTANAEIDFLSFSLADAIATSLSALDTLVVRSSMVAARFADATPDIARISSEANVDLVLTGTLLSAGSRLRVAVQLVEAPSGRLVWSETSQVEIGDIFLLQDDLTRRIVDSLALPLSGRERRALQRDVPASAQAYEYYLRATQLGRDSSQVELARDMYLETVRADPNYAPAWARLGQLHRLIGKYRGDSESMTRAEVAVSRALELNPDLSFADRIYAQIEVDHGRAAEAMARLLRRSKLRTNDPDLFAGLVHSCRYCGLFDGSLAAHERAKRLDPAVRTSVQYTLLFVGDYERAVAESSGLDNVKGLAMAMLGDPAAAEYMRLQAKQLADVNLDHISRFCTGVAIMVEGDVRPMRAAIDAWLEAGLRDPEAWFLHGLLLSGGGEFDRAIELIRKAISHGYTLHDTLSRHRWLDPLRDRDDFKLLLHEAHIKYVAARSTFEELGGIPA